MKQHAWFVRSRFRNWRLLCFSIVLIPTQLFCVATVIYVSRCNTISSIFLSILKVIQTGFTLVPSHRHEWLAHAGGSNTVDIFRFAVFERGSGKVEKEVSQHPWPAQCSSTLANGSSHSIIEASNFFKNSVTAVPQHFYCCWHILFRILSYIPWFQLLILSGSEATRLGSWITSSKCCDWYVSWESRG